MSTSNSKALGTHSLLGAVWPCMLCASLLMMVGCGPKQAPATPAPSAPPPATSAQPPAPPTQLPQTLPAPAAPPTAAGAPGAAPTAPAAPRPPAVPPLVGDVTRAHLREYAPWQSVLAQTYTPDAATVTAIKSATGDVTVLAIVATWCPDTKRELPRLFAIMDAAGLPESFVKMVGVDRTKKDAGGLTEKWGVTRVPTFVFLRNGQEIGRFVERVPAESTLEREVVRIVRGGNQ